MLILCAHLSSHKCCIAVPVHEILSKLPSDIETLVDLSLMWYSPYLRLDYVMVDAAFSIVRAFPTGNSDRDPLVMLG